MSMQGGFQPGAAVPQVPQDKGVCYGYRAKGDFGDGKHIYYFGRSRQTALYQSILAEDSGRLVYVPENELEDKRKRLLISKSKRLGLNQPSRIVMWGTSEKLEKDWDILRDILRGNLYYNQGQTIN